MSDITTPRPFRVGDRVRILRPACAVEECTEPFVGTLGTVRRLDRGGNPFVEPDAAPDFEHSWYYQPACLALVDAPAAVVPDAVSVLSATVDPTGAHWITVSVPDGWDDVRPLTARVLSFEGQEYVFTGWNSDRNVAYFRTGLPVARVV